MTFQLTAVTRPPAGPTSLNWLVTSFGKSGSTGPLLLPDAFGDGLRRVSFAAPERFSWMQDTLQIQPQISQRTTG